MVLTRLPSARRRPPAARWRRALAPAPGLSLASRNSLLSLASANSVASVLSVLSFASAGSLLSVGSSGSILSLGSAGSILSVGSAGSILSVGSSGTILGMGVRGHLEKVDGRANGQAGPRIVTRTSTVLAVGALAAAMLGR
jgi:hypothetical protein